MNHGMTDRRTSAGIFSMYFVLFMSAFAFWLANVVPAFLG